MRRCRRCLLFKGMTFSASCMRWMESYTEHFFKTCAVYYICKGVDDDASKCTDRISSTDNLVLDNVFETDLLKVFGFAQIKQIKVGDAKSSVTDALRQMLFRTYCFKDFY